MNGSGNRASLPVGALQREPRVDFKSFSPFLGWKVTP
jgi:hypothetical protein